jgi:hypothetical protein
LHLHRYLHPFEEICSTAISTAVWVDAASGAACAI